jgi:hypothetical protein
MGSRCHVGIGASHPSIGARCRKSRPLTHSIAKQKSVPILIRGIACARWRRLDGEGDRETIETVRTEPEIGEDFFV